MSQPATHKLSIVPDSPNTPDSEAEIILRDLHVLRNKIIEAWRERAVILTPEEQRELRGEIRRTCSLLTDLTFGA